MMGNWIGIMTAVMIMTGKGYQRGKTNRFSGLGKDRRADKHTGIPISRLSSSSDCTQSKSFRSYQYRYSRYGHGYKPQRGELQPKDTPVA